MGELGGASSWLNDPAVQTGMIPFALAFGLGALLHMLGAARFAAVSIGAAFLVAYAVFEGVVPFPPPAAKQKIFYLVGIGLAAGVVIDLLNRPSWLSRAALIGFPLACVLWFAWRRLGGSLGGSMDVSFMARLLGLWAGGVLLLSRLDKIGEAQGAVPAGILLIAASLGGVGVAMLGASITLALLAGAVAAATGGATLWSYLSLIVKGRDSPFGMAAVLGGGGALVAAAGVMALYAPQIGKIPLALLLLCLFADRAAQGFRVGGGALARAAEPVVLAALAAVPALAAVGLAYLMSTP